MESLPETLNTLNLEAIRKADLTNEEIIELIALFSSAESALPYAEHIKILAEKYNEEYEMRPLNVQILSLREKFTPRILSNYFNALGTVTYTTLIVDFIRGYQQDPMAGEYLRRLEEATGYQPEEEFIRGLLEFLKQFESEGETSMSPGINQIRRHLQNQLDQVAAFAPIPKYVREFGIQIRDLPHLEEKEISGDLPPSLIAQYLIHQLDKYGIYIEEVEDETKLETLTGYIGQMSLQEREQFSNLVKADPEEIQDLRNNRDIFRVYGPVNAYPDTDYSRLTLDPTFQTLDDGREIVIEGGPDVNVIFGGARMFTDMGIEYDHDYDLPMEDWFTGICGECNKRIKSYHYAVRIPHTAGGWRGCFCNWKCVRDFIEIDTESDVDQYNLYQLQLTLISEYEKLVDEIGIEDRDIEGDEEFEDVEELTETLAQVEIS